MNYLYRLLLVFVCLSLSNCGGTLRSYSPGITVEGDSIKQIEDGEIQRFFDAKPQLTLPVTLSFFNVGYQDNSFIDSLKGIDQVRDIFEIPPTLINPNAAYKRRRGAIDYSFFNPVPVNIKQLRLLSAQAKADLLMVCSISMSIEEKPNSLAWSYLVILPVFFMPAFDIEVSLQADLLYIDVRNGLIYYSTSLKDDKTKKYIHPFKTQSQADLFAKKIISELTDKIVMATKGVITNAENHLRTEDRTE